MLPPRRRVTAHMAAVTIPLLNLRHNGPRGVGTAGLPVKALRQFKTPPPDLVAAEKKKLEAEKVKLVKSLRSGARPPLPPAAATRRCHPPTHPAEDRLASDADMDGVLGVKGKLAKLKENDKKIKQLAAWEKADATVGTVRGHRARVAARAG